MAIYEHPHRVVPADHVPGPKQGHWTYNHYAALADDGKRYEIIDGVLYMPPPSPTGWHQSATNLLATYLTIHVQFKGLGRVYSAPLDVELTHTTVVQPDVLVLLNESLHKFTPERIVGAPDLVVEVFSPSTMTYDKTKKQNAYARAGVKEYWLVDLAAQTIEIVVLEDGSYVSIGIFRGEQILLSKVVADFPVTAKQIFS